MIPRVGQLWAVMRSGRRVHVVIDHFTPRRRENGSRSWVVHYHTRGTWASSGRRAMWLRPFLKKMVPA